MREGAKHPPFYFFCKKKLLQQVAVALQMPEHLHKNCSKGIMAHMAHI